ncbi:hypothetical protein [Vulcanisaeta souniana]|uniref:Uncharacterized protein n=1 Tax=Vulcanisaeta souniana JCM 11219 TaxID=1293586 RepID=A0A830EH71_9CREN|nr:hypothetical protein [Vulcanisaeta souniana]BDR91698.1 hypothetical protein Vsou_07910 [Vulcanisaeta souniana JCM 11219]GGI71142.1 hypothetical protein GCM10007112_05070 [Vulcanisaeta souniana JCM 11219]
MINKNEITKYAVITILMVITITTITSLASQNTIQVNVVVQSMGPLGNASITYMEFVQSYTTQMLHAYGTITTNNEGIAEIPQPPPPLPGKEDVIVITINATVSKATVFRTYTFYLTSENFTNQLNITLPAPESREVSGNQGMLLMAIIIVIVALIVVIILAIRRPRT